MLFEDTPHQTTFAVYRNLESSAEMAKRLVISAIYAPDSTRPLSDACRFQKLEAGLRESANCLKKYTSSSRYRYFKRVPKEVRVAANTAHLAFKEFLEEILARKIPTSLRKET